MVPHLIVGLIVGGMLGVLVMGAITSGRLKEEYRRGYDTAVMRFVRSDTSRER